MKKFVVYGNGCKATELETTMARLLGDVLEMLEDPDANEFDADRIARQIRDVLKAGGVV